MIALVVFAAISIYFLISALVIHLTVKYARRKGLNPWLPGIAAAFVMYMIVFWDFIPVLVNHDNLCKEQGGYWIYKTPEQWFKENPDAIGKKWLKLGEGLRTEEKSGQSRYWLSDYIYSESHFQKHYTHAISKDEYRMIDARTGMILAQMVDFERGGGNPMLHADSITDYKFWLGMGDNNCDSNKRYKFHREIDEMIKKFSIIGGNNNE